MWMCERQSSLPAMGKKKSGHNGGAEKMVEVAARPRKFALKVAMHCRCHGSTGRLRAAVRDLMLAPSVEAMDQSATEATGEVRVLATSDPERPRKVLRKATGKKVDLVFPPAKERKNEEGEHVRAVDAAAVQALFAYLQLHHQYGGQTSVSVWRAGRSRVGGEPAAARPQLRWRRQGLPRGVPVAALLHGVLLLRRARRCCWLGRVWRVRERGG
ncbi:hypothetical protein D1007_29128 [Hordeum vulgare]|nr:hypothetical protein D1007_29128 [Hordeum vulgare]